MATTDESSHEDKIVSDVSATANIPPHPLPENPSSSFTISLYVLREADPDDNWNIQALFEDNLKYNFKAASRLRLPKSKLSKNEQMPTLYRLELPIRLYENNDIFVNQNDQPHPIKTFRLRISQTRSPYPTSHYDDHTVYHLAADPTKPHQFLFNVLFGKSAYVLLAPGIDVSYWDHLCIFSYFIINMKSYDLFDSFLEQFTSSMQENRRSISKENLNKFFQVCRKHYNIIENTVEQEPSALKSLIRMIAPLPIKKENTNGRSEGARMFASIVLQTLLEKLEAVWKTMVDLQWPSYRDGLVTLCCIILLHYQQAGKETTYVFDLLGKIPEEERRQETVVKLLTLLSDVQCTLPKKREVSLYSLLDRNHLTLEHLELATSLETYISYLTQIVIAHQSDVQLLQENIQAQLNKLLEKNHFSMELADIVFVMKYMKDQINESTDEANTRANKSIKFILETNSVMPEKIERKLNEINYHISLEDFHYIHDIIFQYYNPYILHNIDRQQYLIHMLSRRENQTMDHFIIWFKCFLCEYNQDWMDYQQLLIYWTECFFQDQDLFSAVIKQTDILVELWTRVAPEDEQRLNVFLIHMVTQCFRKENMSNLLTNSLNSVQNAKFLHIFKERYSKDKLENHRHDLKQIHSRHNPLCHLMRLDKEQKEKNTLIKDLVARAVSLIEIKEEEVLSNAFSHPSHETLTYAILFDASLNSLPIYAQTMDFLKKQWRIWNTNGIFAKDIRKWKGFSKEQRTIVRQIWNLVIETFGEEQQFDAIFQAADREMQAKLEMKEKIAACLNSYCQQATDREAYHGMAQQWSQRFESEMIKSIETPKMLQEIIPFAEKLNPYVNIRCWRTFLSERRPMEVGDESMNQLNQSTDEPVSPDQIQVDVPNWRTEPLNNKKCLHILQQTIKILDEFHTILQRMCESRKKMSIGKIICLFPDIEQAENDLQLLHDIFYPTALSQLLPIVSFWKDRTRIQHICKGVMLLNAKVSATGDSTLLDSICAINEETLGEQCVLIYEEYQNQIEKKFPERILTFISRYSSSADLFDFLHSLSADDVYNLQESVNDWDETLTSTRTIFDLAIVKNFIDRAYINMNEKRLNSKNIPFKLEHIITCLTNVWDNDQFANLLNCIECSFLALLSIKQIHLELTDKEQSKRHQIAEILQKSTISFLRMGQHETTVFDANIELFTMQRTATDAKQLPKITFADISELRDRARLLEYSTNVQKRDATAADVERDKERLRNFIRFVSIVESVIEILTTLHTAGYPSVLECLAEQKNYSSMNGVYDDLERDNQRLTDILKDWDKKLCDMYETYTELTYFSGDQFWEVEDYIYSGSSFSHPGYHLLKFIGIDPSSIKKPPNRPQKPNDRLEDLGRLLSQRQQEGQSETKRCLLVETTNEGVLRAIVSLFALSKTSPSVNHIFYCTQRTNWIQIRAFIYRCFYSQTCHQLIRAELLSRSIQDQSISLLRSLIEQQPHRTFQMGIVMTTTTADQQLINGLQSMQIGQVVRDHELLKNDVFQQIMQQMIRGCLLVRSRITGLGKSSAIRQAIKVSQKNYVKFPLSGNLDNDTLAERFNSKFPELEIGALHLDIGSMDSHRQLNELLYCLLVFRSFRLGQLAASIPEQTLVYIELDASPQSILNELTVFQHLEHVKQLDHVDWAILDVKNVHIQTVANYLQAIVDQTIAKQDVNPSTFNSLDVKTCARLIRGHFLKQKDLEYITWTQLSIFVAVFHCLFTGFSRCGYFLREYVPRPELRTELVQILLQCSNQFTSLSVEAVRKQQRSATTDEPAVFSDAIIRWDKIQPFTLVFTATDDPLFVYKKPADVPQVLIEYFTIYSKATRQNQHSTAEEMFPDYNNFSHAQFFAKLASLSQKYLNKAICPNCFHQYEYKEQHCQNCSSKDTLIKPRSFNHDDVSIFQIDVAERLQNEYVLTPDNFIKMLLIYLRVQSKIPVLIMGETGCGKTALIQFLCQKILDDTLEVFRVHAGVTAKTIIEAMGNYILQAQMYQAENKRLWVFFDEFNTTSNIGLLKEIMCERTLLGNPLPVNMVFLGACNPRRQKTNKILLNDDAHIGLRKKRYEEQKLIWTGTDRRLLYTVVPIPETMLEYIWDYGYLNEATERAYITTMLNTCCGLSADPLLFNVIVSLLVTSQEHFRDLEDASSVSLRDIARFCRLYNWFRNSLIERARVNKKPDNPELFPRRASLIALLLCYHFRSRSMALQEIYIDKIQSILTRHYPRLAKEPNYLRNNILGVEQKKLINNRMELPPGTAANRALRDNIFVLFACIINRIPLFLCGKPGSSKSSAVQIIISNLKGKNSKDPYFQTLPELVAVSFQGSQNCTSESIIKVFERAGNYSRVKDQSQLLPVIVFDEIGLAELSPHNPLKVLHAELEVENNRYGFVGISNWRLDASKMNRALYLLTPEPNIEDLKLTGQTIVDDMQRSLDGRRIQLEPIIIESLSQAYHGLRENLRETQPDYENYFGLRDYYSLIKGIVRAMMTTENERNVYEIIREHLKLNFDGVLDGSLLLWQHFCQYISKPHLFDEYICPPFDLLLDRTLSSRTGRYLMLIGDSDSAIDYAERFINVHHQKQNIGVRTMVGSSFPRDLLSGNTYAEQYNYRVLMDVILYAETNITLVMRQMGHVYDNLYDLLNQSFAVSAKRKYCRIALGALYHPRCLVHDEFYCVVFIHKRDLDRCDPPFLNRFEKHLIDIEALIHPRHMVVAKELDLWLQSLLPVNTGKHFPLLQHLFVSYSQDAICNLIIETFEELHIPVDNEETDQQRQDILNYCEAKLLHISSFDLPLVLSLQSTPETQRLIDQYYDIHQSITLSQLIETSFGKEDNIAPRIIYTYTQIFHKITVLPETVEEIKLSAFHTERDLTNKIKRHYQPSTRTRLLLIRVDYHSEHEHILSLKHVLLNERDRSSPKGVWIVFHLQRNLLNQTTNDVIFSNWSMNMIDDLNDSIFIPKHILENPSYRDLVLQPHYRLSECLFNDLTDRCLSKYRYIVPHKENEGEINLRRDRVFQLVTQPPAETRSNQFQLRSVVENNLMMLIQNTEISDQTRFRDWRLDILTNGITIASSRSFRSAFQATTSMFHEAHLFLLLAHLEKHNFIDAYFYLSQVADHQIQEFLSPLWQDCLTRTIGQLDLTLIHRDIADIQLIFDLKLPCAAAEYENIRTIRTELQQREDDGNDSLDYSHFAIEQLKTRSIYGGEFIELVLKDERFFKLYFHDQLALHVTETNSQLTSKFVFDLLTSNPTRSFEQNLGLFLAQSTELTEIIRLFEVGSQLAHEEEILHTIRRQLFEIPVNDIKSSKFYSLVVANQQFYQLPPQVTRVEEKWAFQCKGDPMIETGLMNLIELILSPSIIERTKSIQQATTTYSLIAQGVRDLPSYLVNNLEKLRSFISLIRCLTAVLADKALDVFKNVCRQGFDAKFQSCQSVHEFVTYLRTLIIAEGLTIHETAFHRILNKLEVDFLKDWLADNGDSYSDVLILLNKNDNDLWHYSAKLFTYIDRKLDLISTLKENNGQLPVTEAYDQLNHSLERANTTICKVERLMVNRLHMHLMRDVRGDEIDQQLVVHYEQFQENLRSIQNINKADDIQLISILAWLKYYIHMYAFALNNDSRVDVVPRIDQLLTNTTTPFGATVQLFIFKQLLQISGLHLNDMRELYVNRNVIWIKPLIQQPRDGEAQNIRRNLILPTPLFECQQPFQRVSQILREVDKTNELKQIIRECEKSQKFSYAFLSWFIQYYCRFLQPNTQTDGTFVQLIGDGLNQDLVRSFTPLGHRFLVSLCSNFSINSYFRLDPTMTPNEIHKRLIVLNIVAVFISMRATPEVTPLGNLLFDAKRQMPQNYLQHLSTLCLPGMTTSDPVIVQMMDVRTQVQDRLNRGVIHAGGKFIFQCSQQCLWMFYFQDCGVPNDRYICPLCKKPIGAQRHNVLIERDPPQIRMTATEGLRIINQYIDQYNQTVRLGYHNTKSSEGSVMGEKPDHLNRPVSFRFIHLLTHGLLLFLHDLNYLTDNDLKKRLRLPTVTHFRDHFEQDYSLLAQSSTDNQQCYIWLYKLLNHLVHDDFAKRGALNTNENVTELEQLIEQKLIFPHIESVSNEIAEYKKAYAQLIQTSDSKPTIESFIDELFEDEEQYPLLNFFNVTTFFTSNLLDDFILKMQTIPFAEKTYPVTTFLFKRFNDYTNIQHLYPIVLFTNYLIEKFNHRIKRNDAAEKKILHYLTTGPDQHITQQYYNDFLHAWYALDLKEVHYGCQTPKFELNYPREKFAENTSIATLLLNTSKDESSLLLAASLKTIAELQNEIVNFFHNTVEELNGAETKRKHVPLQSIRPVNILRLDRNELSQKLVDDSLVLNYQYGKGRDTIYDYEEIEITLRNMISSLVLIDTDKLRFLNYQFELYGENASLINDVRARIKQQRLPIDERTKLGRLLVGMTNDEILNYLGSLDYVFTYLRNIVLDNTTERKTIQTFVEQNIHSHACLNDNVLRRPPFSTIPLQCIIDLYEMIEENTFDQVLRPYVKKELVEETFSDEERQRLITDFSRMTYEKETIAETLKNIDGWISMLKRLMLRVLNVNISLDVPLQIYLERTDFWSDPVSSNDLETFQVEENILLQHTYVILRGLEQKQKRTNDNSTPKRTELQSALGQRQKAQAWFDTTAKSATNPKVIIDKKKDKPKIRV